MRKQSGKTTKTTKRLFKTSTKRQLTTETDLPKFSIKKRQFSDQDETHSQKSLGWPRTLKQQITVRLRRISESNAGSIRVPT